MNSWRDMHEILKDAVVSNYSPCINNAMPPNPHTSLHNSALANKRPFAVNRINRHDGMLAHDARETNESHMMFYSFSLARRIVANGNKYLVAILYGFIAQDISHYPSVPAVAD